MKILKRIKELLTTIRFRNDDYVAQNYKEYSDRVYTTLYFSKKNNNALILSNDKGFLNEIFNNHIANYNNKTELEIMEMRLKQYTSLTSILIHHLNKYLSNLNIDLVFDKDKIFFNDTKHNHYSIELSCGIISLYKDSEVIKTFDSLRDLIEYVRTICKDH